MKLIYTIVEVIPGDILNIGNPNCRVRVAGPSTHKTILPKLVATWRLIRPENEDANNSEVIDDELRLCPFRSGELV